MIPKKILNYLQKNKIKYKTIYHKTVYTAFDLAKTLKKKISEIAKTLIIKADKNYYLLILPASNQVIFSKLKKLLKVKNIGLIKENLMKKKIKVKPGAIPPFGSLYKLSVYLDKSLKKIKKIIVRAGSYNESMEIKTKDLLKLEKPKEAVFSQKSTLRQGSGHSALRVSGSKRLMVRKSNPSK